METHLPYLENYSKVLLMLDYCVDKKNEKIIFSFEVQFFFKQYLPYHGQSWNIRSICETLVLTSFSSKHT